MEWVPTAVAVYAAMVATGSATWTVFNTWRDRASIGVEVMLRYSESHQRRSYILTISHLKSDEIDDQTRILIVARNRGRRPVFLRGGGFKLTGGKHLLFGGDGLGKNLSKKLDEGESFDTWTYLKEIQERLRRDSIRLPIWAYWATEAGQVYTKKLPKRLLAELLDT